MDTCLVTTTIPYVNARPHVGFALELVQADVIARWHRLKGDDIFFLTGTDENAIKNVLVARDQGLTPRELCDLNAGFFEDLLRRLNISTDAFIRTSSEEHHRGARKFWRACAVDIVTERYRGLYCVGCEDFILERNLLDGTCPIHLKAPEGVEEENYFFKLSRFQDIVQGTIESSAYHIGPATRRAETIAFLRRGLHDFSNSRPIGRSDGWGVRVPGDDSQTVYVWFDALTNYLNGIGYPDDSDLFAKFWQNADRIIHVIGKDVLKFHALYWPAMLSSAGLRLPTDLHVHGFLTVNGQKISKSRGNALDPFPILDRYGADALRYYLLRYVPSGEDSDFSHKRFAEIYESDLANGLGNLVSRLEALAVQSDLKRIKSDSLKLNPPEGLEDRKFHLTVDHLWGRIREINRDIESKRPWEYIRAGRFDVLRPVITGWICELLEFSHHISPFLPDTSAEILSRFSSKTISRGNPLFTRIRETAQT